MGTIAGPIWPPAAQSSANAEWQAVGALLQILDVAKLQVWLVTDCQGIVGACGRGARRRHEALRNLPQQL